jgi:hypothetical protein
MDIKVRGGCRKQKKLAADVVLYTAGSLMSTRMLTGLECVIRVNSLVKREAMFGSCIWNDTYVRPKSFIIEIEKDLDEFTFIETLCHETVHLKQYAMSQLKERYSPRHHLMWYNYDCTDREYEDQPWELEASLIENYLAEQFMDYKYD